MRAMNRFVATGGPARALVDPVVVALIANHDLSGGAHGLRVAFQAKIGAARGQHFVVRCAMRIVAGGAAFADGFVLEHERPALRDMALHARLALGHEGGSAPFDRASLVRIVALAAGDFAIFHRMMMRRIEAGFHIHVAREANLRRLVRVYDRMAGATAVIVHAAGSVAAFATHLSGVCAVRH